MADSRIIRKGFIDSDRVNTLSWFEECLYHRLLLVADDYGLYDARPTFLRSMLFGMKLDAVREADIQRALTAVESAGLVRFYTAAGKPYLQLLNYGQRVQSKARFPLPPDMNPPQLTVNHGEPPQPTVNHRLYGDGVEVINKKQGVGIATAVKADAAAPTRALDFPQTEAEKAWLLALCTAHPTLNADRPLAPDVQAAAAAAYQREPDAVKHAALLADYMSAPVDYIGQRERFWRPASQSTYFEQLADVIGHALKWARFHGKYRRSKSTPTPPPAATAAADDTTDAERASLLQEITNLKSPNNNHTPQQGTSKKPSH